MKKRICVLLALALCLGLGAPALADGEGIEGNVYVALLNGGEVVDGLEVAIITGRDISMKSSGTDTGAGTTAAADMPASGTDTDAGGASAAGADNILPDAWAFFHEEVTHRDKLITNGRMAYFCLEEEDRQACYEYIDLLQSGRFGFTLTDTWEESGPYKAVYCVFDYPGAGPDQEVTSELGDGDVSGDLIVTVYDWQDGGWCDLFIRFSDALTVVDTGDRCTITGLRDLVSAGSAGPMGSAIIDDDDPSPTPLWYGQKCYKCHGAGNVECSQCDGAGGKWIYANTVRTWQRCFRCSGTGEMTCPDCHGSGKG